MSAVDKALAAAEIAASDAGLAIDSHDKSRAMRLAIEAALVEMLPAYIELQKRLALAEAKLEAVYEWGEKYALPQDGKDELDAILDDQ